MERHKKITPNIVSDWQISKHSQNGVECSVCHGDAHTTATDFTKAVIPTPDTCAACHEERVAQFKKGKHAAAWTVINAMPTIHWQPMALIEMFLEHRMRTFQGTFHASPDYALWYGWSEMRRDLTEIQAMADDMHWRRRLERGK